jgi:hypothetical protein
VNVDTPVLEPPSPEEMRAWILNHYGHVRGLCNFKYDSDLTFIRWLRDNKHITIDQFNVAYPNIQIENEQQLKDILERVLVQVWSSLTDRRSDESRKDFLTRMKDAHFISEEDFNAIYQ